MKESEIKNIYIINGGIEFASSGGKLNDLLSKTAEETLSKLGKNVSTLRITGGYTIEKEAEKIIASDCIIWQMPVWWMAEPWTVKKYIDEVFIAINRKIGGSDGRHRADPTARYGTGGKLHIKYMISSTWNAPQEAFYDEGGFFDAGGIDKIWYSFHKAMQFIGMSALPSFMCNDVIKNPQIEQYVDAYQNHLKAVFDK